MDIIQDAVVSESFARIIPKPVSVSEWEIKCWCLQGENVTYTDDWSTRQKGVFIGKRPEALAFLGK